MYKMLRMRQIVVSMYSVCQFITVAALTLHSLFGCSLHHACAGCTHAHRNLAESQHTIDHGCSHDSPNERREASGKHERSEQAPSLLATDLPCQHAPSEHGDEGCHSEIECSFLPASPIDFGVGEVPVAYFEGPSAQPDLLLAGLFSPGHRKKPAGFCWDPPSLCALHCTWQI